ncbi:peptide synthase [Legionella quinlivanii]|uniref:Peptide synthase n=1 Tax=Legionella quinlivanii TaxID=45073 RepID=A0A0W0Y194_9GAMM|nr:acyl carrier protein [Legionella quinlivanii]KTD50480.1 peptide synthase [Legionella quinlivanii]SEF39336.1 Aryl carrier domain-containing protein [Legionella quinlivanii DSM 21216]STY12080.1 Polyketide synthase module [Legionella quinlivanii]
MNTQQFNTLIADEEIPDGLIDSLQKCWLELFNSTSIDLNESFFHLGADSITVLKLLFRIQQQFGIRLVFRDIFENPTINLQAHLIKCKTHELS